MARHISLEPHLTIAELEGRYQSTKDLVERSRWHFLWLLARGLTAKVIASLTGYSAYWIGRIARRYNEHGSDGVKDLRRQLRPSIPLLSAAQQDELVAALAAGGAPEGERWSGRTVAAWNSQRLGRRIGRQLGWTSLRRLGARLRMPRPRHVQADPQAQADFKQRLRPLLREVTGSSSPSKTSRSSASGWSASSAATTATSKRAYAAAGRVTRRRSGVPAPTPPDINDGVKVNVRPYQELSLLASQVIKKWD